MVLISAFRICLNKKPKMGQPIKAITSGAYRLIKSAHTIHIIYPEAYIAKARSRDPLFVEPPHLAPIHMSRESRVMASDMAIRASTMNA